MRGIIALAWAAGIAAARIVNLYAEKGLSIFPYQSSWRRKFGVQTYIRCFKIIM
ncbi:hypothetical protein [Bacillus cereus group sp. BfR-BA-01495]|uniref:hypothetical protein n=1 Tax=Bacillus cereus group sp. BfR-BA-01495 TaxID=2920363 RepID=UPI001F561ACA|nr:hypothetical protein [Bacillus cereus group sp. BfR-BA-01495]